VKNWAILIILGKQNPEEIKHKWCFCTPNLNNVSALACEMQNSSNWSKSYRFLVEIRSLWKHLGVLSHKILNFRRTVSQVTIACNDTSSLIWHSYVTTSYLLCWHLAHISTRLMWPALILCCFSMYTRSFCEFLRRASVKNKNFSFVKNKPYFMHWKFIQLQLQMLKMMYCWKWLP